MKKYKGYDLLLGGLFMAMALVFPMIFHAIGLGSAFLPMFYPIIAAGFLVALPVSVIVGVTSPLLSSLLTGMPPLFPPVALIMMMEGAVLTALPGFLYPRIMNNAWVITLLTMAADRIIMLLATFFFSRLLELPEGFMSAAALINGLPGTILILVLIPPLVKQMEKKIRLVRTLE